MREGRRRVGKGGSGATAAAAVVLASILFPAVPLSRSPLPTGILAAQPSRHWSPADRLFFSDLSQVFSVAATPAVVYAATSGGLAVYDRAFLSWRETIGPLDGLDTRGVRAIAADPGDDAVWLAAAGRWMRYEPLGRRIESGSLPGQADLVVLDSREPGRGAWFRVGQGWYFVARGADAVPARDVPPPARRIGPLAEPELLRRVPMFEVARARLTRDEMLRTWRITSAAAPPAGTDVYVGTDGNGAFRVDAVTAEVRHLSQGLLGPRATAVAFARGQVCVAASVTSLAPRRGVTCGGEELREPVYLERVRPLAGLPGTTVSHLLLTERFVWAATDHGLVRFDRRDERRTVVVNGADLPSERVLALAAAVEGVWAGTDRGLALLTDSGRTARVLRTVVTDPVLSLVTLNDTLWVGTSRGLAMVPPLADGPVAAGEAGAPPEPVVALAVRDREVLAVTPSRLLLRRRGAWLQFPPAHEVGRVAAAAGDEDGFWIAGTTGLLYVGASTGARIAITSPEDLPLPANDVIATREHVWVATDYGLVRLSRSAVLP